MTKITENSTVKLHYTGRLSNNQVFDSSVAVEGYPHLLDREPLEVTLGENRLIPGFENALKGMEVGEKKTVTIPCNEAYGQPKEEFIHEVPLDILPEGVKVGDPLVNQTPQGNINVLVVEVNEETATLDANNPLAGEDLTFDIEIMEIS